MKHKWLVVAALAAGLLAAAAWREIGPLPAPAWTDDDVAVLVSLSIDALPPLAPDPTNAVADRQDAAHLGQLLFFDTRLSANGAVSCATCHQPERRFTDGLPKGRGLALSARNTMSVVGSAYSPWLYWDGRKDSQWSQALSPLEDRAEHGSSRLEIVQLIRDDVNYRQRYEALFGPFPDIADPTRFPRQGGPFSTDSASWKAMKEEDRHRINVIFTNVGKAIAAYERLLLPGRSRFDDYVAAVTAADAGRQKTYFSTAEARGLRLFLGKARCIECHNGPLLTNNEFHNTGILSFPGALPDRARIDGVDEVLADPFNCAGAYSDDVERRCPELVFVRDGPELIGATRTPSLRNLGGTAPYARQGQLPSLADVIEHYDRALPAMIGHNEAKVLGLSRRERRELEAFLRTLDAPLATAAEWLEPPARRAVAP